MNFPVPVYGDKKIICTGDGSFTFYSMGYGESYKARSLGAYTESLHKFAGASGIIDILRDKDARLLDICFGIGMNLAATAEKMVSFGCTGRLHAVSVEMDGSLPYLVERVPVLFPIKGYGILREAVKKGRSGNFSLELHIRDALGLIDDLTGKFDVIYFDPFSKKHNPEMWSDRVFKKMYALLENGGRLVTYASGKTVRAAISKAGFRLTEIYSIGSRYQPSLLAEK